jgi:hypothetical protein
VKDFDFGTKTGGDAPEPSETAESCLKADVEIDEMDCLRRTSAEEIVSRLSTLGSCRHAAAGMGGVGRVAGIC